MPTLLSDPLPAAGFFIQYDIQPKSSTPFSRDLTILCTPFDNPLLDYGYR